MELREKNFETLKNNYYLSFIDERVLSTLSSIAAEKELNLYIYSTGRRSKWGLSADFRLIASKEEKKEFIKSRWGTITYNEYIELFYMERVYVARTPRGALWRNVLEAIDKLENLGKEEEVIEEVVEEVVEN